MNYELLLPEVIRFGPGVRFQLPDLLPEGVNILFVCGRHSAERITSDIFPMLNGRRCAVFSEVPPELPLDTIDGILEAAEAIDAGAIVGWGGGSAMDAAKAAAVLYRSGADIRDAFYGRCGLPLRKVYFAALPTTSGTGAEITANSVLCDRESGIKQSLRAPGMTADAALIDTELMYGAPVSVIAASGFDALTQCIESYLSNKADSLTKMLALAGAKAIYRNLEAACGGSHPAMDEVAMGSMQGGIAFSKSGLGAAHGIGHPAGSLLHMAHGTVCAVLLTESLKKVLAADRRVISELAAALVESAPEDLISGLAALRSRIGLPDKLTGLTAEDYPFIVANCRSGSMKCNPCYLTDGEVREILETLS